MAYWNQKKNYKSVNSPESYLNKTLNTEFTCSELGSYSIDAQGNVYNNSQKELRSLIPDYHRTYGSNLTTGFDPSLLQGHGNLEKPLHTFLRWIVFNKDEISSETQGSRHAQRELNAEFVLTRARTIKKLLATVFNTGKYKQPWKMYATKYNGTIYISDEEDKIEAEGPPREPRLGCRNREEEMKKVLYVRKKVEGLISEPCESQDMPAERVVEGRKGFYSVRKGKYGGRHLVLTTVKVDFVENGEYMDLKLGFEYTDGDEWKFPFYKLRDWWYDMYAGYMKQVVYAIRDGPRLKRVSRVKQSEIRNQVQNPRMSCPPAIEMALRSWNPLASIGFVDDFLQWLKGIVVEDNYGVDGSRAVQYVLEWEKGSPAIGYSREEVRKSNFVLLPDWYIREMSAFFA